MPRMIELVKIYPESFRANIYNVKPFRMIGLIDVSIRYPYGVERVTLAYYRSSGTNNGKIKGLWYPIVGIKIRDGSFTEFTPYLNYVLSNTTRSRRAKRGWLAKSLFFGHRYTKGVNIRGFSNGRHYEFLHGTGKILRELYESNRFVLIKSLNARELNNVVTSKEIYPNNNHTQRENYERYISDIFNDYQR